MVDYVVDEVKKKGKGDVSCDPTALSDLRTSCEEAKISLSSGNGTVPVKIKDLNFECFITEEKFVELNCDLLSKCFHITKACLNDAKIGIDAVDKVILAGGSTRMPLIYNEMQSYFHGKVAMIGQNLEAATACGAAYQAFFLSNFTSL